MNPIYFLRVCVGIGMTISGVLRLRNPEIGASEIRSLWLFTPTTETLIAVFELLGAPILLMGALYMQKHRLEEIKHLVAFTGDMKTIWYHTLIATIMAAIIMAP